MSSNIELQQRKEAAMPRGYANLHPVYAEHASNAELWDVEGRRYIDFAAGIAVLNTGHVHARVRAAVAAQLQRFSHTCFQVVPYEPAVQLAERLNAVVPGSGPKKTLFVTTGAEAVENAVKIARAHTRRSGVIAFGGGFHGRTHMGMALTGKVQPYKALMGPFPAEIYHAPFPVPYHGVSVADALKGIQLLFKADIEPGRVAAVLIEPVQGEGGFYVAPREFMTALRALCDEHGIVLIVDEVQSGFARTGRLFAIEHYGVEPDLVTLAKGMAGGFPLAAVTGKAAIMDAPAPGGLGGTYASSPIGAAAALAVFEVIEEEHLCARAESIGQALTARLAALQARYPDRIGDVRGLGAMVALELVRNGDPHQPDADLTRALVQAGLRHGLILLSCGVYANVVRLLAPLTASDAIIDEGLSLFEAAFAEVAGSGMVRAAGF